MPYISKDRRKDLDHLPEPRNAGELNFVITSMLLKFLGPNPNYSAFNAAVGVLECAKIELARRSIANYEDLKASENGDIDYPYRSNIDG
jgi:hypothetical protein